MDIMTLMMKELHLERSIHMQANFRAPWSIQIPKEPFASFHFVHEGSCYIQFDERGFLPLKQGDLVVFPKGAQRTLSDHPQTPSTPMYRLLPPIEPDTIFFPMELGEDGELTRLWGGGLFLQNSKDNPILEALPHALLIRAEDMDSSSWLAAHMSCLFEEGLSERPGRGVIISKMSEVLFLHAIRTYLELSNIETTGLLQAIQDPRLVPVMLALHRKTGDSWTVDSLARLAKMSRASFASLFPTVLGQTPMRYLSELRLKKAAHMLQATSRSVVDIALEVGYQSQPPFSTAFRHFFGMSPRDYRKQQQESRI